MVIINCISEFHTIEWNRDTIIPLNDIKYRFIPTHEAKMRNELAFF